MRYGFGCEVAGGQFYVSLSSFITFVNHGCNETDSVVNVDGLMGTFEGQDDDDTSAASKGKLGGQKAIWDPVIMRRFAEHCVETRISYV